MKLTEKKYRLFRNALCVGALCVMAVPKAYACSNHEYEVCTIVCYCVPNGGSLIPDPRDDIKSAVKALNDGDNKAFARSIGKLILAHGFFPGTKKSVQTTVTEEEMALIEQTVGEGFIVITGKALGAKEAAAAIVLSDRRQASAYKVPLTAKMTGLSRQNTGADGQTGVATTTVNQSSSTPPSPPNRPRKVFYAPEATCLVTNGKISAAGWPHEFLLIDKKDPSSAQNPQKFPHVAIQAGDIVEITAKKKCIEAKHKSQKSVEHTRLVYKLGDVTPTASPTHMKYFLIGSISTDRAVPVREIKGDGTPFQADKKATPEGVLLSTRHHAIRGIRQGSPSFGGGVSSAVVAIPRGAKSVGTYVDYEYQPGCEGQSTPHGSRFSLLVDAKEVDSVNLTYHKGSAPPYLYAELPPGAKTVELKSDTANTNWCAAYVWKEPTFYVAK